MTLSDPGSAARTLALSRGLSLSAPWSSSESLVHLHRRRRPGTLTCSAHRKRCLSNERTREQLAIHGETRGETRGGTLSADAASWRGPESSRRQLASDPLRTRTKSHANAAHTARSRVRLILTPQVVLVTAISRMRAGPMVRETF